jgi:hypothetical protein
MNWDLTSSVQDIVNGATTNYGWQLMDHGSSNPMIYFYTKEHTDPTYYPILEVDVTLIEDQTPPVTDIVLGNPHSIEDDGSVWLTSDTSFTLVATDNQAIPESTSYTGVQTTIYRIDNEVDQVYTGSFNLTGYPPEIPHQISYWSIDFAGNIE